MKATTRKKAEAMASMSYKEFKKIITFRSLFMANFIMLYETQKNFLSEISTWLCNTIKFSTYLIFFPISKYVFYRYAVKAAQEDLAKEEKVKNKFCKKNK